MSQVFNNFVRLLGAEMWLFEGTFFFTHALATVFCFFHLLQDILLILLVGLELELALSV